VAKQSYQSLLFAAGGASGFYAPVGVDPDADIAGWFARIQAGEPYDDPLSRDLLREIQQHHSAYYIDDRKPSRKKGHGHWWRKRGHRHWHWWHKPKRVRPAPILAYNSWLDDLFYADEPLRLRNLVLDRHPSAEFSVLLAAGAGHPRAGGPSPAELGELTGDFFDRHLKGARGNPLGVRTYTQACNGSTQMGPFDTRTWRGQHPGEVRINSSAPQTFTGLGGNPAIATGLDVIAAGQCPVRPSALEPNTATYDGAAAQNGGYTMIGSPTVIARLTASGSNAQVSARLWDVGPDGNQAFITRGTFRPAAGTRKVVFQLHPQGWHFAPGHFPRLQLLGRDAPYQRASNGAFSVTVRDLQLRLPVRQRPGSGQVRWPGWPLDRDGTFARPWEIAWR
ncbi:MAG: CocE/NonD family hydrolase C-terminal non-catalytic domain-containing protein, partial [Solirubrobacterales bacterium]